MIHADIKIRFVLYLDKVMVFLDGTREGCISLDVKKGMGRVVNYS